MLQHFGLGCSNPAVVVSARLFSDPFEAKHPGAELVRCHEGCFYSSIRAPRVNNVKKSRFKSGSCRTACLQCSSSTRLTAEQPELVGGPSQRSVAWAKCMVGCHCAEEGHVAQPQSWRCRGRRALVCPVAKSTMVRRVDCHFAGAKSGASRRWEKLGQSVVNRFSSRDGLFPRPGHRRSRQPEFTRQARPCR